MKTVFTTVSTALLVLLASVAVADDKPRFVLQITVDQLRGDLPMRYRDRFAKGGFRYLLDEGLHYANAHYLHANTETVVGHASLATGTWPAVHGMVGNLWLDRQQGRIVYNIEDADYKLLSDGADVDDSVEIDPTQRAAKVDGRSPSNILVSTFSDELIANSNGQSKVFGISIKDRAAVTLAGHMGKAFWFSKSAQTFVTSDYYYDAYPEWVMDWNNSGAVQRYAKTDWTLLQSRERYLFANSDDRHWETDLPGFGRTFPHPFGAVDNPLYGTLLTVSPAGDELLLDFALELIEQEKLGDDAVPDFLAISFSSTDYVGHLFGHSSLEAEDNMLRLDRTLARLFQRVDEAVGLENTLIVLSADHGGPDTPKYLASHGYKGLDYFHPEQIAREPIMTELQQRFGLGEALIDRYAHPYLYLNVDAISEAELELAEVREVIANELQALRGIRYAVSSSSLVRNELPDIPALDKVRNNFHAGRSGDIYLVFDPYVFINEMDGLSVASSHGSPWSYDTFVPIFFAGFDVEDGTVHRPVTPYDIAPTLSGKLGVRAPSGATGQPLLEVFED